MRKFLLSSVLFCTASLAQAQDAALIVGVSRYDTLSDVRGARDVADAGDALQDMGFTVFGSDATDGRDLQAEANAFADLSEQADRMVVVLAGQFVTDGTRTWLMAADSKRPAPFSVANGAISVEAALKMLGQAPGSAVLVLGRNERADADLGWTLREGIGDLDIPSGVTVVQG